MDDKIPKEGMHQTCIVSISIDSVMKMEEKNYPQVYLKECKYKIKKIKMPGFIDVELEPDRSSGSDDCNSLLTIIPLTFI